MRQTARSGAAAFERVVQRVVLEGVGGRATYDVLAGSGIWGDAAVQCDGRCWGGWADVQRTTRSWAAAFGGTMAVRLAVLLGERQRCRGRHGGRSRGEVAVQRTTRGLWAAAFGDNAAVQRAVLLGERRRCNRQCCRGEARARGP